MINKLMLSDIDELAPMPASVSRLIAIVNDPNTTIAEIAHVVEFDQAVTANILRIANSAWSSPQNEIVSVKQAVLRLGGARVLGLAIAKHVSSQMSAAVDGYELAEYELWRHSVASALAVDNLSHFVSIQVPGIAFTAALLHDIGKLVLARHITINELKEIRELISNDSISYLDAEFSVLGTNHAEVGGVIAKHWKFPEILVQSIETHHDVDVEPEPVFMAVQIANIVAKLIGVGLGSEQMNMDVNSDMDIRLGMTRIGLEALCVRVKSELTKAEKLYGSTSNGA